MPGCTTEGYSRRDTRKIWRYPGVPIPWRLQSKYKKG
jgi:hypothetical protein